MTDDVDGSGEIKLVHMGSCTVENGGVRGHQFAKIVQDQACEDFLSDELRSFRVKMLQANGMLEITKSSFNPPALVIHFLESGGKESLSRLVMRYSQTPGEISTETTRKSKG